MNRAANAARFLIVLILTLLCLCLFHAQAQTTGKNSLALYAVGDFPPTNYVDLDPQVFSFPLLVSSNRAAAGLAGEYAYNYTPHFAVGALLEWNPSDGKLLQGSATPHPVYSIWPLGHYETALMMTQSAPLGTSDVWVYIQEGMGAIVTNGPTNSGVSHDIAFFTGTGINWQFATHWSARVGALFVNSHTGCYDGRACTDEWGVTEDAHLGVRYSW